jgi:hypothetical protein
MAITLLKSDMSLKTSLLSINELKPHEKGLPSYLQILKQEIIRDGVLRFPIIADQESFVILDGMHRWLALKSLGYEEIPAILVDAQKNTSIHVGRRRIHRYVIDSTVEINIRDVISAGLSGQLMKPRTTRHFFPFSKNQEINYPLALLKKGSEQDVSRYLSENSPQACVSIMNEWLQEISEELELLDKRKEEVEKEKQELINRITNFNGDS